jgi:prophage DNA circulation protein
VLAEAAKEIGDLGDAADRATARIRALIDEHLGTVMRERRIDRERLVAELAGSLVERSAALARQAHELEGILERARLGLAGTADPASAEAARPATSMRRLAVELIDSGSTPEEVATQLRRLFGVSDGSEIVAEVLASARGTGR